MNLRHFTMPMLAVCMMAVAATFGLSACKQEPTPPPAPAKPVIDQAALDQAQSGFDNFLNQQNFEMAERMGDNILKTFPDTPEAKGIEAKMPEIREKAAAQREKKRLENLWSYLKSPLAGGKGHQQTASIRASDKSQVPAENKRVELILRSRTDWGLSAFMFVEKPMKSCKNRCTIKLTFDGKTSNWRAFISGPKDPPAVFIEDYNRFVDTLNKSQHLKVELKDGLGFPEFEIGGFKQSKYTKKREK